MLLPDCSTPIGIVLVGVIDHKGMMRFPVDAPETPGLMFQPKPLTPINEQIMDRVRKVVPDFLPANIDVCQEFSDEIKLSDSRIATLYLATLKDMPEKVQEDWKILPDLLRAMPKNRNRLAYLKAWQVLTGSLALNTKVVEEQEMQRHLENDAKRNKDLN